MALTAKRHNAQRTNAGGGRRRLTDARDVINSRQKRPRALAGIGKNLNNQALRKRGISTAMLRAAARRKAAGARTQLTNRPGARTVRQGRRIFNASGSGSVVRERVLVDTGSEQIVQRVIVRPGANSGAGTAARGRRGANATYVPPPAATIRTEIYKALGLATRDGATTTGGAAGLSRRMAGRLDSGATKAPEVQPTPVLVSNLNSTVTEHDVNELFSEIGEITSAQFVSPGTALVAYKRKTDAIKACTTYNLRLLDGHPMTCTVLTNELLMGRSASGRPTVPPVPTPGRSYAPMDF